MKNFKSPVGLNPGGVGPKIVRRTLPFIFAAIALSVWFPDIAGIPFIQSPYLKFTGWIWTALGFIVWVAAIAQFAKGFPKGALVTNGLYSLSRNPIYSSYILFILPGIALICNNWCFLLSAVVMYIATIILVKDEEAQLQLTFGSQYTRYCQKTNRVFFFPRL
jgi:protein-S-isoprenylcysteine O-methyltransferase Ste14